MKAYSRELSADSSLIVIPFITMLVVMASLFAGFNTGRPGGVWHYWVIAGASFLGAHLAWRLIKRDSLELGSDLFIGIHLILIALLLYRDWQPGSAIPFFFGPFIVISGMIRHPRTGFIVWGAATFLSLVSVGMGRFPSDISFIGTLLPAITINFLIALVGFLSAVEWSFAVESISELHRKVQRRRDELFATQEELRKLNALLQASNEQLEIARNTAVTERDLRARFMNNVSHELRTPLNAIVNFAHILAQGGRAPVTEAQRDYLQRIEQSGWHLLSVLNDLLDMAQIEAGEFKLQLEETHLHTVCEEAMLSVHGLLLNNKKVELLREYPQEWPLVKADQMRLKQALINLLSNAVKYTPEGYICLAVRPEKRWVYISVADTGIGIAPEYHEVIFQDFRQVDETAARRRMGTGLGLPITRHLVERHGGSISLHSNVGEGSVFTIKLPVWRPEENAPPENGMA